MPALIEISSLHCRYREHEALKGISFQVDAGEMTGILGPNGSGKSTLLLAMSAAVPIAEGRIRIAGIEVDSRSAPAIARKAASVPQSTEVTFPFKCLSLVLMGRYPHLSGWGEYSEQDIGIAMEAMEQTGTTHLAGRRIGEISGGEARLVTIARAMAQTPEILLLDEATSNLDVARKMEIFDLLAKKNRNSVTVLCVMHDLNLAALYCRRLIFLKEGRVALDGPTEEIFNDINLSQIYETEIRVSRHPVTGGPQAHFVPGRGSDRVPGTAGDRSGSIRGD